MQPWITRATNAFPLWVLAGGALAIIHPPTVTWFDGDWITYGLAIIMLGMGITLSINDFKQVRTMPRAVTVGVLAQYIIMPILGWTVAQMLTLPLPLAVGVILVASCPGGTASNVVTFLARGHLALSVVMTMVSTFAAVAMTPILTKSLAGTLVPVPAWGLFLSTVKVVLAPVLLGLTLHHLTPRLVKTILPVAPLVSVIFIALICASIIGSSVDALKESGFRLLSALLLLHSGGFLLGYLTAKLSGYPTIICRTVSIEVGMQNSGLGTVLAKRHFAADPLTALPGAISATVHSVLGSILAAWWRLHPAEKAHELTASLQLQPGPALPHTPESRSSD
jgi:BASS family bile acid:Na+ symporter